MNSYKMLGKFTIIMLNFFFLLPLGEAGDWKNWLKVAQSEALDAEVQAANIPLAIKYM